MEVHARDLLWIKRLGEGGFGEVWKCHYRHSGLQAVKFLKKLTPQNIEAQQEVLRRVLDHSRIMLPVGCGISSSGYDTIMTECATYGDLQTVLDLKQDLSIQCRLQMAVEIAEGKWFSRNPVLRSWRPHQALSLQACTTCTTSGQRSFTWT
jgi:serine/threonine protein kinase